jgi:dolichol-phosphate mannosyltransferase
MRKITFIIPCYNESKAIGKVLDDIPHDKLHARGFEANALVIDNNSTDRTAAVAKKKGATVIKETKVGKGHALMTGFRALDKDTTYVIIIDGDNTYKPNEIFRLIEPLESEFCHVVTGSRLNGKRLDNSHKSSHRVVNWLFTFFVRHFYHANITDALTGYLAFRKSKLDQLIPHLTASDFSIEMEMITKMVRIGHEVYSVPITYDQRIGETKIEGIKDGLKILHMFFKNLYWYPPKDENRASNRRYIPVS